MTFFGRQSGIRGCPTNLINDDGTRGKNVKYAPCENDTDRGKIAIEIEPGERLLGRRGHLYMSDSVCGETANCEGMRPYAGPAHQRRASIKPSSDTSIYNMFSSLISGETSNETLGGTTYIRTTDDPSTLRGRENITILGSSPEESKGSFKRALLGLYSPALNVNLADILSTAFDKAGRTIGFLGMGSRETPFTLYMVNPIKGGARRKLKTHKNKAPKWVSTGRRAVLKDGSKRTVYKNTGTGELRYKKYVVRAGKRVATYFKFK